MRSSTTFCVFLAAAALSSCGYEDGPNISGIYGYNIASVRITPPLDTIFITDTIRSSDRAFFAAQAIGHSQITLAVDAFVWESSNPAVATVDGAGVVTPHTAGTTEISASAGKIGRATLVVAPATAVINISPATDTIIVGSVIVPASDTLRLTASAFSRAGVLLTGVSFTWESLTTSVATVDQDGLVHAVALGASTIRVRTAGAQSTAVVTVFRP